MKKIIILLCFLAVSLSASAQIGYQQTYNNRQQQYSAPQPVTKSYRTTGYMSDARGNVYKMPIMVEVTMREYGSMTMRVSQKYVDTGFGGRWEKIYSGGYVRECQSFVSNNALESQFMYKATIDTNTWYFDL